MASGAEGANPPAGTSISNTSTPNNNRKNTTKVKINYLNNPKIINLKEQSKN